MSGQEQPEQSPDLYTIPTNIPLMSEGRMKLQQWLGRPMRIQIKDGRILVGYFTCTDRDVNILLNRCCSYWMQEGQNEKYLGSVMVRKENIVSISIAQNLNK